MAMVKCKECNKDVSSSAKTCPNCGIEAPGEQKASTQKPQASISGIQHVLIGVVALFIIIGWIVKSDQSERSEPENGASQTEEDRTPSPEVQRKVAGFITGRGLWCGQVVNFHEEKWDSTVNKKVYYAFCDDGSNAQAYILTFNGKGVLMSVKEK